jgi:hypothetical protein
MDIVPPRDCKGELDVSIRLWYYQPVQSSNFETGANYGPWSNWVQVPCPPSVEVAYTVENFQYLDITFQTLDLFEIDDDDVLASIQDVELYGYFRVLAPSMGQEIEDPTDCLFDIPGTCVKDTYTSYTRRNINIADWPKEQACTDCYKLRTSGHYDLSEWWFCQSTNKYSCLYEGQNTSYKANNNTIRVYVKEGDALGLEVRLIDYDDASEDDGICWYTEMTPSRSLEEWAAIQNETYTFYGNITPSGRCTVEVEINAVTP